MMDWSLFADLPGRICTVRPLFKRVSPWLVVILSGSIAMLVVFAMAYLEVLSSIANIIPSSRSDWRASSTCFCCFITSLACSEVLTSMEMRLHNRQAVLNHLVGSSALINFIFGFWMSSVSILNIVCSTLNRGPWVFQKLQRILRVYSKRRTRMFGDGREPC